MTTKNIGGIITWLKGWFYDKDDVDDLFDSLGSRQYYATCSSMSTSQIKEVTIPNFSLETGVVVNVKFENAQTSSSPLKLKVNEDVLESITISNVNANMYFVYLYWQANEVVPMVYNGSNFVVINKSSATTSYYGVTKLSSSISPSESLSATPKAVKTAYDLADSKADENHKHNNQIETPTDENNRTDLNDYVEWGSYYFEGTIEWVDNAPRGLGNYFLLSVENVGDSIVKQTLTNPLSNSTPMFVRVKRGDTGGENDDGWGEWIRITGENILFCSDDGTIDSHDDSIWTNVDYLTRDTDYSIITATADVNKYININSDVMVEVDVWTDMGASSTLFTIRTGSTNLRSIAPRHCNLTQNTWGHVKIKIQDSKVSVVGGSLTDIDVTGYNRFSIRASANYYTYFKNLKIYRI